MTVTMIPPRRRRRISLENLKLSNPQRHLIAQLLASQKNKYKKLLHETHERLHIIADFTTSLEFWYNVSGHYEHISPSCERITGYRREEFLHRSVTLEQLVHPDSLEQFLEDRKRSLQGAAGKEREFKIIRKNGDVRWALATWTPVHTRKGKHIGIRISIIDITQQKHLERATRQYKALYRALAEWTDNVAFLSFTLEGEIRSWSRQAEILFGYTDEEIIGKDISLLQTAKSPEEPFLDVASRLSGNSHLLSATCRKKDGATFPSLVHLTGLSSNDELEEIHCLVHEEPRLKPAAQ